MRIPAVDNIAARRSIVGTPSTCRRRREAALKRLQAAVEAVDWARNSGDGTVSLNDIDELTAAARALT